MARIQSQFQEVFQRRGFLFHSRRPKKLPAFKARLRIAKKSRIFPAPRKVGLAAAMSAVLSLEARDGSKIQSIPKKVGDHCVEVQRSSSTDAHHGEEPHSDYAVLIAADGGATNVQSPSEHFAPLLDSEERPDTIEKQFKDAKKSLSHIAHLNGLRALAFIGVALFHFQHGTRGGFLGVDVFFVLSGYLMTRSIREQIQTGTFTYADFLKRRFWRLYPALLCTILGTLGLTYLFFSNELAVQIARSAEASLFAVSNILFKSEEGYFGTASSLKPLLHTWSLSLEWQFYLLWPLFMLILDRWNLLSAYPFIVLSLLSFGFGWFMATFDPTGAFFFLPGRVFEFGLGAMALTASPTVTSKLLANAMSFSGTALIVASFLLLESSTAAPALIALPPIAGALLIIASPSQTWANCLYTAPVMEYLGKISYSAYLVHWPIYVFYNNLYEYEDPPWQVETAVVTAMMGISAAMYHFVEEKMRTGKERGHRVLGLCMVAVTVIVSHHCLSASSWTGRHSIDRKGLGENFTHNSLPVTKSGRRLLKHDNDFQYVLVSHKPAKSIKLTDEFDGLIIGDSFAEPTIGVFETIATKHNMTFLIGGGGACPPFFDEASLDPKRLMRRISKNCMWNVRRNYLDFIKTTKARKLFLIGNWYFAPEFWQEVGRNEFEVSTSRFEDSIDTLRKLGKRIVVIGQIPGPHYNPKLCLESAGPLAFLKNCPKRFRFQEPYKGSPEFVSKMNERNLVRKTIINLFKDSKMFQKEITEGRLAFVDPYKSLCNAKQGDCAAIIDGEAVFRDLSHLSRKGSQLMENQIYEALMKLHR